MCGFDGVGGEVRTSSTTIYIELQHRQLLFCFIPAGIEIISEEKHTGREELSLSLALVVPEAFSSNR